jgi:hypothetical protein
MDALRAHLRQPASSCPACDMDGDGVISVGDARRLITGTALVLNFDPKVLEFQSYRLGTQLTDPVFGQEDLSDTSGVAIGALGLGEVSWLLDFSGQPDAFVLASASFAPLASGTSLLTLSAIDLSDDLAGSLQVGAVGDARVSVPVPGGLLLLPIGLGLFALRGHWSRRSSLLPSLP